MFLCLSPTFSQQLFPKMSSHMAVANSSRSFNNSLYHHMPFLLNQQHHEGYGGSTSNRRMGIPMIIMPPEWSGQEETKLIDPGAILEACKKETYVPSRLPQGTSIGSEYVECSICLEKFATNDKLLRLPCNHPFHVDCIVPWIRSNHDGCPVCRATITPKRSLPSGNFNNATRTSAYTNPSREAPANYGNTPMPINILNERNFPRGIINDGYGQISNPPQQTSRGPSTQRLPSMARNLHHVPSLVNYGPNVREFPISSQRQPPSRETSGSNQRPPIRDTPNSSHSMISNQRPPIRDTPSSSHSLSNHRASSYCAPPIIDIPIHHQRPSHYPSQFSSNDGSRERHINPPLLGIPDDEKFVFTQGGLNFWI